MNIKTVLLGSAAGLIAATAVSAADLPVKAKPVEYVKICTLYGDGFYYIPGSDTCIKFSGYIRADYGYNVSGGRNPQYTGAAGARDRSVSTFTTRHRGSFSADTRTQTAYGTLRTFSTFHLQNQDTTEATNVARAFIQWGGFTFGRTVSYLQSPGGLGDSQLNSLHSLPITYDTGATGVNQIAYTWQIGNGVTLNVGADERGIKSIANWSVNTTAIGTDPTSFRAGASHPDPWVALQVRQAWGGASLAVVATHNQASYYTVGNGCAGGQTSTTLCGSPGDQWGFAVLSGTDIKLDMLSPGTHFAIYGSYGVGATAYAGGGLLFSPGLYGSGNQIAFGVVTDAVYVNGRGLEQTTSWTIAGGLEYYWTRNFSSTVYGGYAGVTYNSAVVDNRLFCGGGGGVAQNIVVGAGTVCDPSFNLWLLGTHHDWFPIPGLRFSVDVMHTGVKTAMEGATVTLATKQGNRPSGVYTVKDLGITSVIFRAQRTWGG